MDLSSILSAIRSTLGKYFNISGDLVPQYEAESEIRAGVSFKGTQLLILIFAIFIASLGLNTNSIPVIIGAMLISPLMGPIIGMGLGMGIEDFDLLKRSLRNLAIAVIGSIAASAIYFLCSPLYEGSSQLLARTSPTIYDVLIGLFGGAAGIVSIGSKNKGQVMPGVAIATSLMPPLCTAGYGLSTLQANFFFGALYLFFINAIFILFASWVGVKVMKYHKPVLSDDKRSKRIQSLMLVILTCTIVLSIFLTYRMVYKSRFMMKAQDFVSQCLVFPNTQVLSHSEYLKDGHGVIDVNLIGDALPIDSLNTALGIKLDSMGLGGTRLHLHQGFSFREPMHSTHTNDDMTQIVNVLQDKITHQQSVIDSLNNVLSQKKEFMAKSAGIIRELNVIDQTVEDLALSEFRIFGEKSSDSDNSPSYIAFVKTSSPLKAGQQEKIVKFLRLRLDTPGLQVLINPVGFDWRNNSFTINSHEPENPVDRR